MKECLIVDQSDTQILYKYVHDGETHNLIAEGGLWNPGVEGNSLAKITEDPYSGTVVIETMDKKQKVCYDMAEAWYVMTLLQKVFPNAKTKTYTLEVNDEQEDSKVL